MNEQLYRPVVALFAALGLYLFMAFAGIHYGLPDAGHTFSYNCDEFGWIEAMGSLNPHEGKFNPYPRLRAPSLYLEMYGATLLVGQAVGWIPPNNGKEWFRTHPEQWARFYLAGRYLQVFCGVLLLLALWFGALKIFNDTVATMSVLLFSVTPSLVAASHFGQASLPVALFGLLSCGCLLYEAKQQFASGRWLCWSALFAGMAVSAKFSGLALALPLAYVAYRVGLKPKILWGAVSCGVLGFLIGTPYSVLAPHDFLAAIAHKTYVTALVDVPSGNAGKTFIAPLTAYSYALGPVLLGACLLVPIVGGLRRYDSVEKVLLIWMASFYVCTVKVGTLASSARVLIGMPAGVVLLAITLDRFQSRNFRRAWTVGGLVALLMAATLFPTMAIVSLRRSEPIQKQADAWIEANIPKDKSIAIPREIFWWTPDAIYGSAHHPERLANPYTIQVLEFSREYGESLKPDYIVATTLERNECPDSAGLDATRCADFYAWLDNENNFEVVKRFPRKISFLGWSWNRPETGPSFDDDLWNTALTVYKRKTAS